MRDSTRGGLVHCRPLDNTFAPSSGSRRDVTRRRWLAVFVLIISRMDFTPLRLDSGPSLMQCTFRLHFAFLLIES